MVRDRMAAIRASQDNTEFTSIELGDLNNGPSFDDFYNEVHDLDCEIDTLKDNIEKVKLIHSTILSDPQVGDEVKANLDKATVYIKDDLKKLKSKLKKMEEKNQLIAQTNPFSVEHRIRRTQHLALQHKFIEVAHDYQLHQSTYRDKCKERIRRQLEITHRETNDDEIEEMIEQNNPAIFTKDIITDTEKQRQALAEIEARHNDIIKLEKSIKELSELFIDMANLVENQGEMIDRIENHVLDSKSHVEKARNDVKEAVTFRNKARIKKLICFTILILVVIAVFFSAIFL